MALQRIHFQTHASTSVEVDVPDHITDPYEIAAYAEEQGLDVPTLCHHCEGGGRYGQNLELGDDWQPVSVGDTLLDPGKLR